MPSSTLNHLVQVHHRQARDMCRRTFFCRRTYYGSGIDELRRVGNKFTTRVEKRLRKMEARR